MNVKVDDLIEIKLPNWEKTGETSMLIRPELAAGVIPANYNADRLTIDVKLMTFSTPQVRIAAPRNNVEFLFNEDDALALVTCILSKLYALKKVKR